MDLQCQMCGVNYVDAAGVFTTDGAWLCDTCCNKLLDIEQEAQYVPSNEV